MEGFHLTGCLMVLLPSLLTFVGNFFLPFWVTPPNLFFTMPFLIPPLQIFPGILCSKFKYRWPAYALFFVLALMSTLVLVYAHVALVLDLVLRGITSNSDFVNIALFLEVCLVMVASLGQVIVLVSLGTLLFDAFSKYTRIPSAPTPTPTTSATMKRKNSRLVMLVFLSFLQSFLVGLVLYLQAPPSNTNFSPWYLWAFAAPFLLDWIVVVLWWVHGIGHSTYATFHLYLSGIEFVWSILGFVLTWTLVRSVTTDAYSSSASIVGVWLLFILAFLIFILRLISGIWRWKMADDR